MAEHKGKILNRYFERRAKQARYSKDGIWYHDLQHFPADLYDANGVVRFDSEREYRRHIRIGPHPNYIHADHGISEIQGYTVLEPRPCTLVPPSKAR